MDMAAQQTPNSKVRKLILSMGIGGVVGFLVAFGFLNLADSGIVGSLDNSREIAGLVGLLYVATGMFVGFGVFAPQAGARFLNVEDGDELIEQRKLLTYSSIGMIALGIALVVAALAAPLGPISETVVIGVVVAFVAVTWFTGSRQRRHTDELMQTISRESTSTAFYMLFLLGGGWSLLAHLDMVTAARPLDWLTMFAAVMLIGSFWTCARRGLLTPR